MGWRDSKHKKLRIPYYPTNEGGKENPYVIETASYKMVSNYLMVSLFEVDALDIIEFKYYLREAFIYNCSKTPEGLEYLINAKRLEQVEPDRASLRDKYSN